MISFVGGQSSGKVRTIPGLFVRPEPRLKESGKLFHGKQINGNPDQSDETRPRLWVLWVIVLLGFLLFASGCAKYNTYFNAKRAFDQAEQVREDAIKQHKDPPKPSGQQKTNYEDAARKAQKLIDEYPGHSLTDDALFLQGKAYYRLESYRMSIRQFDLLFTNYPASEYMEESLYLQALNFLLIGALDRSQDYLDLLAAQYPESEYQAETLKVSGDNAYTLEKWEMAALAYQDYLDNYPDDSSRDRIGLKLAECYWELREYEKAAVVLQDVSNSTTSAELGFRSRLLRSRVHVRMGDFEVSDLLVGELENEAQVYNARGDVVIVQAESLVAQGKGDEASPLLENIPVEWETPDVKARSAEILGNLYLERGDLEEAKLQFQDSIRRKDALEDENRCRILNQTLGDYLAAEEALPDAPAERVPRLKLLQANSLLFGFERPGEAARLYAEAGADTAADSTTAARALYGAVISYRDFLDKPDSAQIFADRLLADHPDSPQAFEVSENTDGNLLGYLLARKETQQRENYANLTPEELTELNTIKDLEELAAASTAARMSGVRRRKIFLARRDHLVFEPSEELIQARADRAQQEAQERGLKTAAGAGAMAIPAVSDTLNTLSGGLLPGQTIPAGQAASDSTIIMRSDILGPDGKPLEPIPTDQQKAKAEEEKKKKKKKKDPNEFDLR